jgi:hypothetical protein
MAGTSFKMAGTSLKMAGTSLKMANKFQNAWMTCFKIVD